VIKRVKSAVGGQRGALQWVLIASILVITIAMVILSTTVAHNRRTQATNSQIALTQQTDAAVSAAVARLSAGQSLPATRAGAQVECEKVGERPMCFAYWGLPRPGNAVEPVSYDLVTNVWADPDGDRAPGPGDRVRAVRVPLDAVTYQTGDQGPTTQAGKILYTATPSGLFRNALFGFSSTQLSGRDVSVKSYNSTLGTLNTKNGTVASGGWVSYGPGTAADSTLLYGYAGAGGVNTSRCTGETCEESDVRVLTHGYATATEQSVAWMGEASCTTRVTGDWVASEQAATIPSGTLCIDGNLVIDVPTRVAVGTASVYVRGNVEITSNLNAPSTITANPGTLFLYSSGQSVAISPTVVTDPGTVVAAMLYAPRAVCSTDPANERTAGGFRGQMTWYGSLVCDTVSLGGSWTHLYDDAGTFAYRDPVPDVARAWTVGVYDIIDTGEQWDVAPGWDIAACMVPTPVNATAYWRLNEPTGLVAADSVGGNDLEWKDDQRVDGMCGRGAGATAGGQATSGTATVSTHSAGQFTLEFWAKAPAENEVSVQVGGVKVTLDQTGHVALGVAGKSAKFPFTVQNRDKWHLYSVSLVPTAGYTLSIDGRYIIGTSQFATPAAGPTVIADGTAGSISDVVFYSRPFTSADVSARWAAWNNAASWTLSDPGKAFTAPTGVSTAGSTNSKVVLSWAPPTGTFPAGSTYTVERATTTAGPWTSLATLPSGGATTYTDTNPARGDYLYHVCATYNDDTRCSAAFRVITVPLPVAPDPVTFSSVTGTSVKVSWPAQEFATSYTYRWRQNSGAYTTVSTTGTSVSLTGLTEGAIVDFSVQTVNAAGTSAWSANARQTLTLRAPTITVGTITESSIAFSWAAVPNAARYDLRYAYDGGGNSTIYDNGTSRSKSFTGRNPGSIVTLLVRAVAADGKLGEWGEATANTTISAPVTDTWQTAASYPTVQVRRTNSSGEQICPGTGVYLQYRFQTRLTNTTTYGALSAWTQVGTTSTVSTYASRTTTYTTGAVFSYQMRCVNNASGVASTTWSSTRTVWHEVPKATGLSVVKQGTSVAWSASCAQGVVRYDYDIVSAVAGHIGPAVESSLPSRSLGTTSWGATTAEVWAYCKVDSYDPDLISRYSPKVKVTAKW